MCKTVQKVFEIEQVILYYNFLLGSKRYKTLKLMVQYLNDIYHSAQK